ncbi:MAG TPA: hypothetical protein VL346_08760 [Acidobacteriaceae bacterium]|jgi:hypothetical protein|nr:hypothetical protein [Acidobacteriaceae bacterium]
MSVAADQERSIASILITGILGAGLIYYGRRSKGILGAISTTAGYSLLTKAVSSGITTALESTHG